MHDPLTKVLGQRRGHGQLHRSHPQHPGIRTLDSVQDRTALESTSEITATVLFDGPARQVTRFRFGSQSTIATEALRRASVVAITKDSVDLPTPPLALATVMMATEHSIPRRRVRS